MVELNETSKMNDGNQAKLKTIGETQRNSKMNGESCKILEKPPQNSLLNLQQLAVGLMF